ncbi:hypothetical protein Tco_0094504, partial [Tanacetum coccineum]
MESLTRSRKTKDDQRSNNSANLKPRTKKNEALKSLLG